MKRATTLDLGAQDVFARSSMGPMAQSRTHPADHSAPVRSNQGIRREASSFRKALLEFADEYELLQADIIALQSENQHLMRSAVLFSDVLPPKRPMNAPTLGTALFRAPAPAQDLNSSKLTSEDASRNALPAGMNGIAPSRSAEAQVGGSEPLRGIHLDIMEVSASVTADDVPQERLVHDFAPPRSSAEGNGLFSNIADGLMPQEVDMIEWSKECGSPTETGKVAKIALMGSSSLGSGLPNRSSTESGGVMLNSGSRASAGSLSKTDTMGSMNNAFMMRMSQLFPTWFDPGMANPICSPLEETPPMQTMNPEGFQLEDERAKGRCLLGPVSRARLIWDLLATICLFCELWTTPFELIFVPRMEVLFLQVVSYGITAFFTVDIMLNFSTGYIEGTKSVIMARGQIIRHYLRSWFIVDLIATIPLDLILASVDGDFFAAARLGKGSKMFKTFRYLKLIRAVRMLRTITRARNYQSSFDTHWLLRMMFWPVLVSMLLALLSHFNGCLFAALQPDWAASENVADGLLRYYDSFTFAYVKLIGITAETDRRSLPTLWTWDCLMASERLALVVILGRRLILYFLSLEDEAREKVIQENARQYLRRRNVSFRTQLEVLYSIQETAKAQNMQKHFKELCSNDMPTQLRRTISQELWSSKLMSLGLIMHIAHWSDDFVNELALLVREEIFPSHACMFREGEAAIAAYYIIEGELLVWGSMAPAGSIPDYVAGMWLGEKALVNPLLRRSASVTTKALTMVMAISSNSFQDLLTYLGLMAQFQTFCSEQLWRGLCGRCGVLGDHFADTCPKICGYIDVGPMISDGPQQDNRSPKASRRRSSRRVSVGWGEVGSLIDFPKGGAIRSILSSRPQLARTESRASERNVRKNQDLRRFLQRQKKEMLLPVLREVDIESLEDLEQADQEALKVKLDLSLDDLECISPEAIAEFREQTARAVHKALFRSSPKNQYLVFLSHHKEGAGTEAALLRTELIKAISQDPGSPAHSFDVPVFLDSEDLQNLSDVQERVVMSHNLVVLLTNDVFIRPWVLVELVTARRSGLRILPVRVCKPANEFEMPDEDFYKALVDGSILSAASSKMLSDCDIELAEVAKAIRHMFNRIMIPYSPHRSEAVRQAEVRDLLKQCALKPRQARTSVGSCDVCVGPSDRASRDTRETMTSAVSGDIESENSLIVGDFSDKRFSMRPAAVGTSTQDAEAACESRNSGMSAYSALSDPHLQAYSQRAI